MKKTLALLIALVMIVSLFAACGETGTTTTPSTGTTTTPSTGSSDSSGTGSTTTPSTGSTTTPSTGSTTTPSTGSTTTEPAGPRKITGVIDVTDDYSMAIKSPGAAAADRTSIRCEAGKIQVATYNAAGTARVAKDVVTIDFASLGVEGYAWEYLGSTLEVEVDGDNVKVLSKPEKCTFIVPTETITFPNEETAKLPNGEEFDLKTISSGVLRGGHLINEGGKVIPGWMDKAGVAASSDHTLAGYAKASFWSESKGGYVLFAKVPLYNQTICLNIMKTEDLPAGYSDPAGFEKAEYANKKTIVIFGDGMFKYNVEGFLKEMANQTDTDLNVIQLTYGPLTNPTSTYNFHEICVFDKETSDPDIANAKVMGLKESSSTVQKLIDALADKENPIDAFICTTPRDWYLATADTYRKILGLKAAAYVEEQVYASNPDAKFITIVPFAFEDGYDFAAMAKSAGGLPYTSYAEHLAGIKTASEEFLAVLKSPVVLHLEDAWDTIKTTTSIALYDNGIKNDSGSIVNEHHLPSVEGGYLIAAMIYQALFETTAEGLTTESTDIKAEDIATLQSTAAQFDSGSSKAAILITGDFVLGENGFGDIFSSFLKAAGYSREYKYIDEGYAATPKTNVSRLEFYELFSFDDDNNCKGFGTGARGQRLQGYFDEGVSIVVFNAGRREIGEEQKSAIKARNAAKWLAATYPDVKVYFLEDQPYKDGTFDKTTAADSTTIIANDYTGNNAADHLAKIDANLERMVANMDPKPEVIKFGTAVLDATNKGADLYAKETPYLEHTNTDGTYLAACMVFEAIFGEESPTILAEGVSDEAAIKAISKAFAGKELAPSTAPIPEAKPTETPATDTPAAATVKATIDMTDLYTLVIKTVGASGDDRTGVRAAAGKIEAGVYSANGRTRTESYEFDFASLGLEGYAWEYLGAEVEIDTSGATPKLVGKPAKSTFCVTLDKVTFDSATKATVGGVEFDLAKINWGLLRPNTLLNEGGQYIPGWNDPSISSKDSGIFTSASRKVSLYFFVNAPMFKKQMCVSYADTTYDKNAPLPEGVTLPTT